MYEALTEPVQTAENRGRGTGHGAALGCVKSCINAAK